MPLTASQILAEQPNPPQLVHKFKSTRAHESSSSNQRYQTITRESLTEFSAERVQQFRLFKARLDDVVDFMDSSPKYYPLPSSLLHNESDVRSYVDVAIVRPVWPVILSMLPNTREYDLILFNNWVYSEPTARAAADISAVQYSLIDDARPSVTYSLVVELKAPCLVRDAVRVYQGSWSESDDWITVTRQVRKHAVVTQCRHHILMDDRTAIYFHFKSLRDDNEEIYFAVACAPICAGSIGNTHGLTIRELFAFAAWNALGTSENGDFGLSGGVRVYDEGGPCRPFIHRLVYQGGPPTDLTSDTGRPTRTRDEQRHEEESVNLLGLTLQLKLCLSVKLSPQDYAPRITKYSELRLLINEASDSDSGSNSGPDSGYHSSHGDDIDPVLTLRPFPYIAQLPSNLIFRIIHSFKPNVFIVRSSSGVKYVLKRFVGELCWLQLELVAYAVMRDLQGHGVPKCLGLFTDVGGNGLFLCLEFVPFAPLSSIYDFRRIEAAKVEALELLDKIHNHGIAHNDPSTRNILVADNTDGTVKPTVVILDFGLSSYSPLDRYYRIDRTMLCSAFDRAIEDIERGAERGAELRS